MTGYSLAGRLFSRRPCAQLPIEIEQRSRVGADHLEFRDDLARRLLLLYLFGQKPLQLGDRGESLLVKGDLVQRIDLAADFLFLLERAFEHVSNALVVRLRLLDRRQFDVAIAGEHEIEELHGVHVFFLALQSEPARRPGELLALAYADIARYAYDALSSELICRLMASRTRGFIQSF